MRKILPAGGDLCRRGANYGRFLTTGRIAMIRKRRKMVADRPVKKTHTQAHPPPADGQRGGEDDIHNNNDGCGSNHDRHSVSAAIMTFPRQDGSPRARGGAMRR